MTTAASFWDGIAERYAREPISNPDAYEASLARTVSYLKASDTVLELGAGTSSTALRLAPHVADYTATDVSKEMVRIGREKAEAAGQSNLSVVQAESGDARLQGDPKDVVLAFNLLHLVDPLPEVLRDVAALVKPGGYFISKTPTVFGRETPLKMRMLVWLLPLAQLLGKAPKPVRFHTTAALEGMIAAAGFTIVETGSYPVAPPNRYVVARRTS